jgi:lysyl-tRNA synthetase, class II
MADSSIESQQARNTQIKQRRAKLAALREAGEAYRTGFKPDSNAAHLHEAYDGYSKQALADAEPVRVTMAGRMMTRRIMGKASFFTFQDGSGAMQCYVARDQLEEGFYATFKDWDLGDIVGVEGYLFRTKVGELSVHADRLVLLTKALQPLPDKYHGLQDQEQRYRQRYVDLMVNEKARHIFKTRTKIISAMRAYLDAQHFMEVETPMMHPLIGGASAKPFETYHNTLDMKLYMRIAPELYLKRLIVGGFERVYEINRNFRNEGISTRHNPEFTSVEFYQAYATYTDLMDLTEDLLRHIANVALGQTHFVYQGIAMDMAKPFDRITMVDAILKAEPSITSEDLQAYDRAAAVCTRLGFGVPAHAGLGKLVMLLFEELVEPHLAQPTFITGFPKEVSPLARSSDEDPDVVDRFELYMAGKEIANGFSELNDPDDQAERFKAQLEAKEKGDDEAMSYDEDYINALTYGMPPTAGEGIGIDRLVMMLTDAPTIREVILFPQLRAK